MEDFKIKDVLIEHSNALRELLRSSRAHGKEEEKHIKRAVGHVRMLLTAVDRHEPQDVPADTKERAEKAIEYVESGDIDEGRAVLLEMGRIFDDFVHGR